PCPCLTTSVESPETNARGTLPHEYSDLQEVLSKERATRLPPHRPWDCAIKLFPNAMLPKNRVYPLSLPETKAMEDYIEEALSAGHIHISTAPVAAGFFFVKKKDGGLHPCIDYCGLNAITVCYPYPFPLVSAALEQLQGANIFSNWIYGQESKNPLPHPEPILPPVVILGPIQWDLVGEIQRALADEPPPTACPPSKLYVPSPLHQRVIQWTYESPSTGHPGIHHTTHLVQQGVWWPSAVQDIERYVRSCTTCAQSRPTP
ncbi:hypothetical protein QTP70_034179, partial [Hemibagrus guttatus]